MSEEQQKMTSQSSFMDVKVGDIITRLFYGHKLPLTVSEVDEKNIHTTGGWMFDRATGIEYDPDIGMGVEFGISCSQLIRE